MIVKIDEQDITRIEKEGHTRDDFTMPDPMGKDFTVLKQKNGACVFLKRRGEEFICSIYEQRPEVCRKFPFMKRGLKLTDCRPKNWQKWTPIKEIVKE